MSRRKHVTLNSLQQDVEPPKEGQQIVRALGTRGGNIVEIQYPNGTESLALMPARFIKKLWVRKGGYLMVEHSDEAEGDCKITATILAVLYDEHIRAMKKIPGAWPPEFTLQEEEGNSSAPSDLPKNSLPPSDGEVEVAEDDDEDEEDDGLPPLEANTNRRVVYHDVSDSDDDSDNGS